MNNLYRKKPVVIEAVLNDGMHVEQIEALTCNACTELRFLPDDSIEIDTLEGTMRVDHYDWIIKGVKGELYPCKPDIFELTYEGVG